MALILKPHDALMQAALLIATINSACSDSTAQCEAATNVVDHQRWTLLDETRDPFARDGGVGDAGTSSTAGSGRCAAENIGVEDLGDELSVTVTTVGCHWATVEQPALFAIDKGEPISIRIWHYAQISPPEESLAELLVAIEGEVFWRGSVPLPTTSGLIAQTFASPIDIAQGAMLRFHLSNHGSNSWNLIELSALRTVPCADASVR